MNENVGEQIKKTAKVIAVVGLIGSVIVGIGVGRGSASGQLINAYSIGIIIAGGLTACLGAFVLYGFGELIETVSELKSCVSEMQKHQREKLNKLDSSVSEIQKAQREELEEE